MNRLLFSLVVLTATGCASVPYGYRQTTGNVAKPRPANCEFDVLSLPPSVQYQELGIIELDALGPLATDPMQFAASVRNQVCQAGGDALIATPDQHGRYQRGTVLLTANAPSRSAEDAQLQSGGATSPAPAATAAPVAAPASTEWTCKPEDNPAWSSASASQKKQMVDACLKPTQPAPPAPAQ